MRTLRLKRWIMMGVGAAYFTALGFTADRVIMHITAPATSETPSTRTEPIDRHCDDPFPSWTSDELRYDANDGSAGRVEHEWPDMRCVASHGLNGPSEF